MACGKQPRYFDGVGDVGGRPQQVDHPTSGYIEAHTDGEPCVFVQTSCSGWVHVEAQDNRVPRLKPCPVCRPGNHAVWFVGALRRGWERDPQARQVYRMATGEYPVTQHKRKGKGRWKYPDDLAIEEGEIHGKS